MTDVALQIITNFLQGVAQFPVTLYIALFTKAVSSQFTATVVLSLLALGAISLGLIRLLGVA